MGRSKEGNAKSSQAMHVTSNVDMYHHHDWASMQAYYGPRVAAIPQYYYSNVANGHAPPPPYMWPSPLPMMAPYGAPYPLFYPPGGVYAHPGVQMGSQSQGPVSQATPVVTTPLSMDDPGNSPGTTDHGFLKKLQLLDELAMSLSNNKIGSAEQSSSEYKSFQRFINDTTSSGNDASSNDSDDGNTTGGEQMKRKRRREIPINTGERPSSQTNSLRGGENEKPDVTMWTPVMPTAMDFQYSDDLNGGIPHPWNEKQAKREKRKQSNRESARRSRMRKQAETEQLAGKVDALVTENMTLRSKVSQLRDESEKLRAENKALLDQLKAQETAKTENLISKVDKNNSELGSKNVGLNATLQEQILQPLADLGGTMST